MGQSLWRGLDFKDVPVAIMAPKVHTNRRRPKHNSVGTVNMLAEFSLGGEYYVATIPEAFVPGRVIMFMKMLLAFLRACIRKVDFAGF